MTTITIKNIPDDLYEMLKRSAELNHRSINSEIIICIERAVRSQNVDPEAILSRARRLREITAGYRISDEEFNQAKNTGRK
jgi:plasmid stability protein